MVASLAQTQLIEQKDQQIAELTKQLTSAHHQLKILQHQVEQLLRRIYGRRSEKIDPNQLMFDSLILQAADQPVEAANEEPEDKPVSPRHRHASNRNHPGRIPIPEHLERVEIILDIPEEDKDRLMVPSLDGFGLDDFDGDRIHELRVRHGSSSIYFQSTQRVPSREYALHSPPGAKRSMQGKRLPIGGCGFTAFFIAPTVTAGGPFPDSHDESGRGLFFGKVYHVEETV